MATKEERNRGIDMQQAFSVLPNQILLDNRLNNESKIIWVYIQGKPKEWDFSADRIATQLQMSEKTVRKYLIQLEGFGYLVRNRQCTGRVEYYLHCPPKDEPSGNSYLVDEKPSGKKAPQQKSPAENFTAISNKELIVIKSNTNKDTVAEDSNGQINPFIELFKDINPTYQVLFQRKDQRDSCLRLLKIKRIDDWQKIIKFVLSRRQDRFCPKISTPSQLEMKYADLETYAMGLKQEVITKKTNVAFL